MFPQNCLNRGHSLLPLGLLALTSCLIISPSQAQTLDDKPLTQKDGSGFGNGGGNGWVVGVGLADSEFAPVSVSSDSRRGINATGDSSSPLKLRSCTSPLTRRGINSTAQSSSPLKWTETQVLSAFSPLERTLAISQGINSLAGNATDARCELKWTETLVESGETSLKETLAINQEINSSFRQFTRDATPPHSPIAQIPQLPPSRNTSPLTPDRPPERPSEPLPEPQPPSPPPASEEVLPSAPPPPTTAEPVPGEVPESITIERFEFEGNTAISNEELAKATAEFTKRPLAFAEVYKVRSVITELYRKRGYITSGAIIPPQTFKKTEGVVKIQVIEGGLEAIEVRGTRRLNPNYIRSRIGLGAGKPLNRNALIEALQLLQLDPLIKNISAELAAGTRSGSSLLIVTVAEAKTFHLDASLNNSRSPNIGTVERRLELTQANLFGQGDGITVGYSNTSGSNTLDAIYTYPLNPQNGTLSFTTSFTFSHVVEPPFNRVDIDADSRYFALSYRQPLWRNLREEFALGLSATNQKSKVTLFDVPVRLSPGTEEDGSTTVTALRFFQDWIQRSNREVLALRSQFSLGLGFLGGTVNEDAPDSNFLAWRGQVQWLRVLAPNTLLILRGDVQVSTNPLLRLEQFGLGGQDTIRGYRENVLLTDNGASASAELRFPILRLPKQNALLQVGPFVDLGFVWNNSGNSDPEPDPNFLAAAGLGFRFQMGDRLSASLDWGFPIIDVISSERTLQENGVYFSVRYRIF